MPTAKKDLIIEAKIPEINVPILKPKPYKKDLIIEAKNRGIKNYSRMRKSQLEEVLSDLSTIFKIQKEIKISLECEHGKNKNMCRICNKKIFCIHDKQKYQCRECGGKGFCIHDKKKNQCRKCNGSSFCEHNKIKSQCKDCFGKNICQHKKQKHQCKDCLIEKYTNWKK